MRHETEAEAGYQDLIDHLLGQPGVTPPQGGSGFGRGAVRFQKKIFVMFVRGRLVLKLPAARVDELVAAGEGVRFDANKGTPMREWLSLDPESGLAWLPLATEALEFAEATHAGGKGRAAPAGEKTGAAQAGEKTGAAQARGKGRAAGAGGKSQAARAGEEGR